MNTKKTQQQTQDFDTQTSIEEINGNPVPVTVFAPVNNGDAANNVPLKDMSPNGQVVSMTLDEQKRQLREMLSRLNRNIIELGVTVVSKRIVQGGIVFEKDSNNKKTETPRIDEFGNEVRYPDTNYITLSFRGGSKEYPVSEDFYNSVDVGGEYLFKGRLGAVRSFGKTDFDIVWNSYEFI